MNLQAVDRIARLLAGRQSRRSGLRAALGGILGSAASAGIGAVPEPAARADRRKPRAEGPCGDGSRSANTCTRNAQCCTRLCNLKAASKNRDGMGRCRCVKQGRACTADRNCCRGRACVDGVCGGQDPAPPPPPPACTPIVCPTCAFTTIQAAIDAAAAGDTIDIGSGTYTESLAIDRNLTLRGCPTATVIDTGANTYTARITGGATVELIDLVIDGSPGANWAQSSLNAGGISCDGNLILSGSTLVTHAAWSLLPPGACVILETDGTLTMNDTATIAECSSDTYGGAGVNGGTGAVIVMNDASTIRDCRTANAMAGAVSVGLGTLTMNGTSTIRDNTAGGGGGGVRAVQSTVVLNDSSSITGNTSTNGDGGGISADTSTVLLNDSASVSGNTAAGLGGGIMLKDILGASSLTLTSGATVTGNSAADGGGVASDGSTGHTLSAPQGTITGNTPNNCAGSGLSCG